MKPICTYGLHAAFQVGVEDAVHNRPVVHRPPLRVLPVGVGRSPLEGRSAIARREQVVCAEVDAPGRELPELREKPDARLSCTHSSAHPHRRSARWGAADLSACPASTRIVTGNALSRGPHVCRGPARNHHRRRRRPGSAAPRSCSASRRDASCRTPCCAQASAGAPPRESYNGPPVRARSESRVRTPMLVPASRWSRACDALNRSQRGTMDTRQHRTWRHGPACRSRRGATPAQPCTCGHRSSARFASPRRPG